MSNLPDSFLPVCNTMLGFLQEAKKETIEDDVSRLVFADWLEEQGDPRGTLIRLQIERARMNLHPREYQQIKEQENPILEQIREWIEPLPSSVSTWHMSRGLISLRLDLIHPRETLEELEQFSWWIWTRRLASYGISDEGAMKLAECPQMENITSLDLEAMSVGPDGAVALAHSPHLCNLVRLKMGSSDIYTRGVSALALSEHLQNLAVLDLRWITINPKSAQALAESPYLKKLEKLILTYNVDRDSQLLLRERFEGQGTEVLFQ